ncbi:MAG TPA: glycosyltransferase [Bryobacteraceae bacterium]|nr:glycosyltransferase [Bryobacteraceae bacterium]
MALYDDLAHSYRLSLIVPCYNEEKRLDTGKFREFLSEPGPTRLVFVDDGSKDRTPQILEQLSKEAGSRAEFLRCPVNGGKAEAVRQGMLHALESFQQEFVGFWDADLATPLETIPQFLSIFDGKPEIEMVFGARVKLLGRAVARKESRHYLGRLFATTVSLMLRLPIYDTQCGAKTFRANRALAEVLRQPFLSKWVFDVEILARFLKLYGRDTKALGKAIYEYPLEQWMDVEGSKVRPKDFLKAFTDVLRIRRAYLSGNPKT